MSPISLLLKAVRNALGLIIVFLDWVSRPRPIQRTAGEQHKAQAKLQGHSLYQYYACPFCVKTRRALHALGVKLETRDVNKDSQHRAELEQGGGRVKVPCLRIDDAGKTRWMYESDDIIEYLKRQVA